MTYYNLTEPLTDKARKALCASIVNWSYRINSDISDCPLCRKCKEKINRIRMIENFNLVNIKWIFQNCMSENGW